MTDQQLQDWLRVYDTAKAKGWTFKQAAYWYFKKYGHWPGWNWPKTPKDPFDRILRVRQVDEADLIPLKQPVENVGSVFPDGHDGGLDESLANRHLLNVVMPGNTRWIGSVNPRELKSLPPAAAASCRVANT